MGSVTSYDVTKGHKKRHELPNFSSDEVTSDGGSDTDDEMNSNGRLPNAKDNNVNNVKSDNKMQRKSENDLDSVYPKPKPRSVQSKMSTGTSSNISSSKSSDSNRAIDSSTIKYRKSDVKNSDKSLSPKSPRLTSNTKSSEITQKVKNNNKTNNVDVNIELNSVRKNDNDKLASDQTRSSHQANTSSNRSYQNAKSNIQERPAEEDSNVNSKGQLGLSKSYADLEGGFSDTKGLRYAVFPTQKRICRYKWCILLKSYVS